MVGSRRRGGGRFEVMGGQETRLIHSLSPPRRTLIFFFLKSLFLCCSYFHQRSRASCVCPITSSSPRRVDLDGDGDNISSVFIHNYDVPVVGLTPTQRCDELFNTQLSEDPPKYRGVCRNFPLNYSSVKFPLKVIFKGEV